MKKTIIIFILIFSNQFLNAQALTISRQELDSLPYIIVDSIPQYLGGNTALLNDIQKEIHFPPLERCEMTGTSYVSFIIETNGKVSGAKLLKGFNEYCDQEAVRVITSLAGWKPGIKNGKIVRIGMTLPVRFPLR